MKSVRLIALLTIALILGGLSFVYVKNSQSDYDNNLCAPRDSVKYAPLKSNSDTIKYDSVKQQLDSIQKDSGFIHPESNTDSIEIAMLSKQVQDVEVKLSKLEENKFWLWTSLGLSGFVLILIAIILKICFILNNKITYSRENIKQTKDRLKQIEISLQNICKPVMVSKISKSDNFSERLGLIEKQIKELLKSANHTERKQSLIPQETSIKELLESGYFGTPVSGSNPYFKDLLRSRCGEERFSVEISGNEAKFEPINETVYLNTYVSSDILRAVIEFVGGTIDNPTQMKIIEPGKAERKNGKWVMVKKTIVQLS